MMRSSNVEVDKMEVKKVRMLQEYLTDQRKLQNDEIWPMFEVYVECFGAYEEET